MGDIRKGQYWRDDHGEFRVMSVAEKYAMVRRKGAMPFCIHFKHFDKYKRLYTAAPARDAAGGGDG